MLLQVPDTSEPTDTRPADPNVQQKDEVEEAVVVRFAEAAEEFCTAGRAMTLEAT